MAATTATGRASREPVYIEEPVFSRWLFGSSSAGWIWLMARVWLGWEWLQAGWSKLFGNITWRFWNWGEGAYSLTGDGNVGWVRTGTVTLPDGSQRAQEVGDAVAGFARGALERGTVGEHPDIACSWYVSFLEWVRDSGHTWLGPVVAVGEVVIGIALILGMFVGIMAFLGAVLNFMFVFAGSAGVNPAMIAVAGLLILAWRNAGWYGLDRFLLPKLGTPGTAASCSPSCRTCAPDRPAQPRDGEDSAAMRGPRACARGAARPGRAGTDGRCGGAGHDRCSTWR